MLLKKRNRDDFIQDMEDEESLKKLAKK